MEKSRLEYFFHCYFLWRKSKGEKALEENGNEKALEKNGNEKVLEENSNGKVLEENNNEKVLSSTFPFLFSMEKKYSKKIAVEKNSNETIRNSNGINIQLNCVFIFCFLTSNELKLLLSFQLRLQ